jgi:hypothetical protein
MRRPRQCAIALIAPLSRQAEVAHQHIGRHHEDEHRKHGVLCTYSPAGSAVMSEILGSINRDGNGAGAYGHVRVRHSDHVNEQRHGQNPAAGSDQPSENPTNEPEARPSAAC